MRDLLLLMTSFGPGFRPHPRSCKISLPRTIKVGHFLNCSDVPWIIQHLRENYPDCHDVQFMPNQAVVTQGCFRFTFAYNNKSRLPYINAEIRAGCNGKNITNMDVRTAYRHLASAAQEVNVRYGIVLRYRWATLSVSRIEINATFPTDQRFFCIDTRK